MLDIRLTFSPRAKTVVPTAKIFLLDISCVRMVVNTIPPRPKGRGFLVSLR